MLRHNPEMMVRLTGSGSPPHGVIRLPPADADIILQPEHLSGIRDHRLLGEIPNDWARREITNFVRGNDGATGDRAPLFRGLLTQRAWPCELVYPDAPVAAYAMSAQGWNPRRARELRSRAGKRAGDPAYVVRLAEGSVLETFSRTEVRLLSGEEHPADSALQAARPPSPR